MTTPEEAAEAVRAVALGLDGGKPAGPAAEAEMARLLRATGQSFGMYTSKGNLEVAAAVRQAAALTAELAPKRVLAILESEMERIARAGHEEVYDTDVREQVAAALDEAWASAYGRRFSFWEI